MKKILTTLLLTFSLFFIAQATHNVAGEITVKQIFNLDYEATINTYTKVSSIPADRDSLIICWGDGVCEFIVRDTFFYLGNDRKHNIYTWTHTYSEYGTYTVSMTDPNRNGGILNVNWPSSHNVPFHIQTTVVVSDFYNTTPILLNSPIDFGYTNELYQHNPAAIDWEGDSLSYELTIPLSALDMEVPNYTYPNQVGGSTNNTLSINSELGTVMWANPELAGVYVISIIIKEHRNGEVISITHRDFEVTVLQGQNPSPLISIPMDEITLNVGDTLKFDVIGDDPEMGNIQVQAIGQPFLLDNPPSFLNSVDFSEAPFNESFEWKIFDNHVYLNPYYLVFRIEEKDDVNFGLTDYHVVKININDSQTNNTLKKKELDVEVFPNPISDGNIFIKIEDKKERENLRIQVISLDGKVMLEKQLKEANNTQPIDLQQLTSGNYFLMIKSKDKIFTTQITIK